MFCHCEERSNLFDIMRTKYTLLFLAIIFFTLFSCTNKDLEKRILELESINKQLSDSIKGYEYKDVLSYQLLLTAEKDSFKVGEKAKIKGSFVKYAYIHSFDVYSGFSKDSLILKDQKLSKFEFDYVPKTITDTMIRVTASFIFDNTNEEIFVPGQLIIKPEK